MDEHGRVSDADRAAGRDPGAAGRQLAGVDVTALLGAREELRALVEEQAALRRVATLVAGDSEPTEVFSVVAREVGCLLGAHTANMIRYQPDAPRATVVGGWSAQGVPNVAVGSAVPLDGNTTACQVWRTGRPARIDSYDGLEGRLAAQLRSLGFRCAVAAPIFLGGRLWGAVLVSSTQPGAFAPGDEQRIAKFAELVGQALANAEALEELAASRARIVQAADAERKRLERNLHDGAQQRLVALSLMLRLAELELSRDPAAVRERLVSARAELDQALSELREIARGLHPAVLSDRGLPFALEVLAARAPVPVELAVAADCRFPEAVEATLYYVVAEALTNIAKHAQASAVTIAVEREDGDVLVTVQDDGVGGADHRRGTGLRGLGDRVAAVRGRLEVDSRPGAGTVLRVRVPHAVG